MTLYRLLAKDCETSGLDSFHIARPFYFSTCDEDGNQCWWEAPVDPLTREVKWSADDLREYEAYCNKFDRWVYQNAKFDLKMERSVGVIHRLIDADDSERQSVQVWNKVEDTVVSGHILASNHPHDLTAMAKEYLGVDIKPLEDRLGECVKECRHIVQQARLRYKRQETKKSGNTLKPIGRNPTPAQIRSLIEEKEWQKVYGPLAHWRIAEEGMDGLPSATGKDVWRCDYWLPKEMARHFKYKQPDNTCEHEWSKEHNWCLKCRGHLWWIALRDYANADTAVTMALWKVHEKQIKERGQWAIYRKQMELSPILHEMECAGVTVSVKQLNSMTQEYQEESKRLGDQCVNIASRYSSVSKDGSDGGYHLVLPDNGVNESLRTFLTDVLRLPPIYNPKAKTDAPTLNKDALEHYQKTLEQGSIEYLFVNSLLDKRQIDTALSFMESYRKFGRVVDGDDTWLLLNPSYKQTGTGTTRLSSYGPNAQQISRKSRFNLRRMFGPTEEQEWWSMDAANIELRIPAYECEEKDLIDLFEKKDDPPYFGSEHILNFSVVYPDIWADAVGKVGLDNVAEYIKTEYKSTWYRRCKNGDFAVQFGAMERSGGMGTADRAFGRPGCHAKLKQRFAKKESLNQWCIKFAENNGYIETLPDRTVDPYKGYPLLCSRTIWGGILPTVPFNYRVQGTAGIWMKHGMIRVQGQLDEWNRERKIVNGKAWYGRIVLTVHDELVFVFPRMEHPKHNPKNSNLWRVRIIKKLMEQGGENLIPSIPTPVNVSYHASNWAEEETI